MFDNYPKLGYLQMYLNKQIIRNPLGRMIMKNARETEKKWQKFWEKNQTFKASFDPEKKKYYVVEMYPYPSGELHMGHVRNYILGDVVARYKRMKGFNVLHPIGWDAFGLPTENAAFSRGIEPVVWNASCVESMTKQFKSLGLSYDWDRVLDTSDSDYYRWVQWFLTRFWEKGLLYKGQANVNWCTGCNTVLANEQVEDEHCERCGSRVVEKTMSQWFLKITEYAERLWDDLELLTEWPARVIAMQKHWLKNNDGSLKIRDWCISRQRYWGAPIPFVVCEECGVQPVPDDQLPILLPLGADISPGWPPPLARIESFVKTTCPKCGESAEMTTDTTDTFVFSAWYFLRFTDSHNQEMPFDSKMANYWMPVDQYVGGIEHATVHLIYARFFHKVLHDMGLVDCPEPFKKLFTQGMICKDGKKMSKSKGNVISPDEMIEQFGTDVTRVYVMFMGPPEMDVEWNEQGVKGISRFLGRVIKFYDSSVNLFDSNWRETVLQASNVSFRRVTHRAIKKVTESIEENLHFHTAISALMEWVTALESYLEEPRRETSVISEALEMMTILISPFAPHMAEEMWEGLGFVDSISFQKWPAWSESLCEQTSVTLIVQINGKMKASIELSKEDSMNQASVEQLATENPKLSELKEKTVIRTVFVPGRIINFVI